MNRNARREGESLERRVAAALMKAREGEREMEQNEKQSVQRRERRREACDAQASAMSQVNE